MSKTVMLACLLFFGHAVGQTIENPDMSEGFITDAGDTVPLGWGFNEDDGTNRCGKPEMIGCVAGVAELGYDMVVYRSAPGALRATGLFVDDTIGGSFDNSIVTTGDLYGKQIEIRGWVRCADVNRSVEVAVKRGCHGGGYVMLDWVTIWSGSGTIEWTPFSGTATFPTTAECAATAVKTPGLTLDVKVTGGGSVWVDDLEVFAEGASSVAPRHRPAARRELRGEQYSIMGRRIGPAGDAARNGIGVSVVRPRGSAVGVYVVR